MTTSESPPEEAASVTLIAMCYRSRCWVALCGNLARAILRHADRDHGLPVSAGKRMPGALRAPDPQEGNADWTHFVSGWTCAGMQSA